MASSSFKSQLKLRMICPPIDFTMRILGPNETQKNIPSSNQIAWQSSWLMGLEDSSFPLDILMKFLSLILILSVRWPSHLTSSS
jgi:hypothetical protein